MKILAIETSCDDTAVAVLEVKGRANPSFDILSNIISSQIEMHKKYGGVFPAMAKREHQKNLVSVLIKGLKEAKVLTKSLKLEAQNHNSKIKAIKIILEREKDLHKKIISFLEKYGKPDIDLIAITHGPGLEPCLWVGINFAKALSYFWNISIVPVNHIESHLLVNILDNRDIKFPAISLIVSGGHTQLILMKGIGKYKILGETRDDAAGECFDKCAKILGLSYPGGPIIAELAKAQLPSQLDGEPIPIRLPRPMISTKDYDFSFSGLKTAVLYHHKKQTKKIQRSKKYIKTMCSEIQQAIIDVLIKKTMKAANDFSVKSIILGGGVSANEELRLQFEAKINSAEPKINFLVPPKNLSTDNAVMTAVTGYFNQRNKIGRAALLSLKAEANLRIG